MSAPKSILCYFTNSYPYGPGELWKKTELEVLSQYYEEIIVVPLSYGGNHIAKPVPGNIRILSPVLGNGHFNKWEYILFMLTFPFRTHSRILLTEFLQQRVFLNRHKFRDWFFTSFQITRFAQHALFRQLEETVNKNITLYFFWGTGLSQSLAFLKKQNFRKVVCRFHGIDLYEERHRSNYIPYRTQQLREIDLALMVSEHGKKYLVSRYDIGSLRCEVRRLGCVSKGLARQSTDGALHIMSCSAIVKVKRLHLIVDALRLLTFPVQWTHIGDGPLRNELEQLSAKLPQNISVDFKGGLPAEKVLAEYADREVDLFVNVSESEGVPVSIMEALSAGIPVIATDAGGTYEIMQGSFGKLIPVRFNESELADEISRFYLLDREQKQEMKINAFHFFSTFCRAETLAHKLAEDLTA